VELLTKADSAARAEVEAKERALAAAERELATMKAEHDRQLTESVTVRKATERKELEDLRAAAAAATTTAKRADAALAVQKQATELVTQELQTKEETWKAAETAARALEAKLRQEIAALKAEPKAKAAPKVKAKAAPKAKAAAKAVPVPSDDDDDDDEMPFADAVEEVEPEIQVRNSARERRCGSLGHHLSFE
jgi:hypothetical protein